MTSPASNPESVVREDLGPISLPSQNGSSPSLNGVAHQSPQVTRHSLLDALEAQIGDKEAVDLDQATHLLARVSFQQLQALLRNPEIWDRREQSGFELETVITDGALLPVFFQEHHQHFPESTYAHIGGELVLSNLEASSYPHEIQGHFLRQMEEAMVACMHLKEDHVLRAAREHGGVVGKPKVLMDGMLGTYQLSDFSGLDVLGGGDRYHNLNDHVMARRNGKVHVHFEGQEVVDFDSFNMAHEGVPTSLQLHFSTAPEKIAEIYNAGLALMGPVLAVATNSPFVFGQKGWHESRIPFFENGVTPDRFYFAKSWATEPEDLFEDVLSFDTLFGYASPEEVQGAINGVKADAHTTTPDLAPLVRHNGTVWKWLRPCYGIDEVHGPHLRIEFRALPAGKTELDNVSTAALFYGVVAGIRRSIPDFTARLNIEDAETNFQHAAQDGLAAKFTWLDGRECTARELLPELIELARFGLAEMGVSKEDVDRYLGVIEERVNTGQTGSQWAFDSLEKLEREDPKASRAAHMQTITACMWHNQDQSRREGGFPVSRWPLADSALAEKVITGTI
ncbi:MAG: hypothetical protein KDD55_03460 [Bdellovibrionales bacterium]|nr:hypothetical protein [Bdellovibrionales bacterium]